MSADFIVVGAGIAGASVAYELARSGRRVCLIEGESRPGYHSTGRSAALFAPSYGGREIRAMTRASRAFFDDPPAGFCAHSLLGDRGCLYIARADQDEQLTRMIDGIRASGGNVMQVDAVQARARVPLLRAGYIAGAAFDLDARDMDVDAIHQGFLRGARTLGADLITSAQLTQLRRKDGLWSMALPGGAVSAPVLINAAGAWADELAVACGAGAIGLQPLRRTALLVEPPAGIDVRQWPAVIDVDEQFYFKPDAGLLLLSPADETPSIPCDAQPEELDIAVAVDRVQAALDLDVQRIKHQWAGLRTFATDRVPVVGFDPGCPGFFWCAGQGGYGIQTAPAMARVAAALAQHEDLPDSVAAEGLRAIDLSPARFAARIPFSGRAAGARSEGY